MDVSEPLVSLSPSTASPISSASEFLLLSAATNSASAVSSESEFLSLARPMEQQPWRPDSSDRFTTQTRTQNSLSKNRAHGNLDDRYILVGPVDLVSSGILRASVSPCFRVSVVQASFVQGLAPFPYDKSELRCMFYRISTDGTEIRLPLADAFSGPSRTGCWIIGGGPSLTALPTERIAASPLPKFSINLAGHGLLRPTYWTAYDPTGRFQKSTYLDPSIMKFIPRGRAMDVVPGTTSKVCDSPNTVFFDRDQTVGFHDFLSRSTTTQTSEAQASLGAITDWQDSLIQAIHIAHAIGFRTLYLAGCDMHVAPGPQWIEQAAAVGVTHSPRELLRDFHQRSTERGITLPEDDPCGSTLQYHFDESKPLAAAIQTDLHYFRVAQYLRLSRRALALAGMELISVTPGSRLNDYFSYVSVESVLDRIATEIGEPRNEPTRGLYSEQLRRTPEGLGPMRDFKPHHWHKAPRAPQATTPVRPTRHERFARAAAEIQDVAVPIGEEG